MPPGFHFAVKASRYITHRLRLRDAGESVDLFVRRIRSLSETLAAHGVAWVAVSSQAVPPVQARGFPPGRALRW